MERKKYDHIFPHLENQQKQRKEVSHKSVGDLADTIYQDPKPHPNNNHVRMRLFSIYNIVLFHFHIN